MANIFTSSIGKKVIMSVSGLFLIVFLLLHLTINALSLISEEAFQATVAFPHMVNGGQETTATLMTGTTPSRHGVMSDQAFNRTYRTTNYTLFDDQSSGIGTSLQLSPRAIATSTITDEWRIQQGTQAKIYAIGFVEQRQVFSADSSETGLVCKTRIEGCGRSVIVQ